MSAPTRNRVVQRAASPDRSIRLTEHVKASSFRSVAASGSWQLQAVEALGPGGCVGVGEEVARLGRTKEIPVHKVGRVLHIESARGGIGKGECHVRSEEHTSELQSLRHLVCRL